MTAFETVYAEDLALIHAYLEQSIPAESADDASSGRALMAQAMSYSLKNGGKRIRPVLTLEFCRACGGDPVSALPFAAALEMVHTYSLIHDDLPCMDDDDYRRGQPSSHKVFGEANALLAGDALLTYAFETALSADADPAVKTEVGLLLARAAGYTGMIAGQVMDLANEAVKADYASVCATEERKTGRMIRAAAEIGCAVAHAAAVQRRAAVEYADAIGLAFQVVDDILDVVGDAQTLGKPIGSDAAQQKSTFVSLLGLTECRAMAADLTARAKDALKIFGSEGAFLSALADRLAAREF